MAAPAYVASGTFVETSVKATNITPGLPAASTGDFQILHVTATAFGTGNISPTIVPPSAADWRPLGSERYASGFTNTRYPRTQLYYRVRQVGDTAPSVQMTGGTNNGTSARIGARIHAFSSVGVVRLTQGDVGDTDPITGTGVTTKAASGLVVAFTAMGDGNTVSGQAFAGGGVTSITERSDDVVSTRLGMSMTTGVKTTAGATGNFTVTSSGLTDPWTVLVLALEETETFPAQSVLDAFTYSDGKLATVSGGLWADDTFGFSNAGVSVVSGKVTSADAFDERSYRVAEHAADGEVAVTVSTLAPANEKGGIGWRVLAPDTAGADGYEMETNQTGNGVRVYRIDNQTYTQIGLFEQPLVAGDKIGARFTGSLHEIFVVPASGPKLHIGSITDGAYTAVGHASITAEGTTVRLDNFVLGPLDTDVTAPSPATLVTAVQVAPDTAYLQFNTPATSDVSFYRVRYKTGLAQTFSGPTEGTLFIADTATVPSVTVGTASVAGLTPGGAYTFGVFIGDEVPNWSTVATDDITLVASTAVAFAPVITGTLAGTLTVAIPLPGEMAGTITAAMTAGVGTPHPPSAISFAPTITATMRGVPRLLEQLGRDRGQSPEEIIGPLGGGQQNPSVLVRGQRGLKSGRLLARMRR